MVMYKAKKQDRHSQVRSQKLQSQELDGVFFLKLVFYVIIGSLWLKTGTDSGDVSVSLPVGLIIGFLFALHEHFQIDRKIEFAVLIVAAFVGFLAPYGIYLMI